VTIGFLAPLSGPYQPVGEDLRAGFELYLDLNGGQLGGRPAEVVVVDEGLGAAEARPAAERLIRQDRVDVMSGILNSDSFLAVYELAVAQGIPIVGANARPTTLWDTGIEQVWTTSWLNPQSGSAIVPFLRERVDGPVWAMGPDNAGGRDLLEAFTAALTESGGQLANPGGRPTFFPFPATNNFVPYLAEIAASDAEAIYIFTAGAQAIDFVTQWDQSPAADLPVYGTGLTEGAVLQAMGGAAEGIFNSHNYSPDLDNPANERFAAEWTDRHDRTPTVFAVNAYDAAQVLDLAIGEIDGEVTPAAIAAAVAGVGLVDSPRGPWYFSPDTHSPVQRWYVRVVEQQGGGWANVLVEELPVIRD
jgi:branched-chain amino acid transport system substrate-binding protein